MRVWVPIPVLVPDLPGAGVVSGRRVANDRLGDLLAEAGWSGAELARAVNALGTLHGLALRYDRTAVAHWLSGTRPRRPVPELMAAALTERCGRLVTVAEAGLGAGSTGPGVRPGADPAPAGAGGDGLLRLALQARADGDPRRRPPLLRSPYQPVPVPEAAWDPDPDRDPDPDPDPDRASRGPGTRTGMPELAARRHLTAHAQQLRALAVSFSGLYLTHGGVHTRAALAAWLARDAGAFAARHPDGSGAGARGRGMPDPGGGAADVWRGYAQLTHLLGEMTADAGHHGLAQEYHGIALALARQAGDRRMYAITLRAMSAHAGRLGQPAHAVRLARTAVETAPADGEPGTLAFLLVQRAAAHAHAGQRAAATADLATADRLHGRHAVKPPGGPFDSYARADLDFARARTHLALGEFPAAAEALERSLRGRPPGQHRATALTHAALAETLLRLGHLTRACEHWRAFLTAAPAVQSRGVREALGRLLRDLTPYRRSREAVPTVAMARALAERLP
ncbi:hypothetical protein [Streptomyces sp. NPDC051546]|uniref:hypothetical protein n=1 Tax=Streptomyces sp. NPDC051546 TaxID=3365655 RepID=UPI0037A2129E